VKEVNKQLFIFCKSYRHRRHRHSRSRWGQGSKRC